MGTLRGRAIPSSTAGAALSDTLTLSSCWSDETSPSKAFLLAASALPKESPPPGKSASPLGPCELYSTPTEGATAFSTLLGQLRPPSSARTRRRLARRPTQPISVFTVGQRKARAFICLSHCANYGRN
ncbi:hypothetical protein IscW_ISCW023824 [Ixodes scapularis]|uniref:Uncharacterized protein n=1 Tax=Ixodes scapularis TaxID=6945 RepID=B7QHM5_IXOSC|nr:hypothetical protein IscW_ISCW023824 [Ixodes scapularis]|eukprot:XP_002414682.1 hypothetical protein IscW_ISCW023824 [Ixodes scapularis]